MWAGAGAVKKGVDESVNNHSQLARAARTVLMECLSLPSGAQVVIFVDETTEEVAKLLAGVALAQDLQPLMLYVPLAHQEQMGSQPLSPFLTQTLDEATAVLVCLNGSPERLAFRDQVRKSALDTQCKVAHMPGIDMRTLSLVDIDFPQLLAHCELLAQALAKGKEMTLITRTVGGEAHRLEIPLRPWERLPIISDGVIQRGSWGNVPSGETYIAPPEGLASGSIVINGSIPKRCLEQGEEFILFFENGWLQDPGEEDPLSDDYPLSRCIQSAGRQADENWRNLAEVGLGVNPRVDELTGVALFDEKKYGTFHIALGDNIDMGGQVASAVHCDMVCVGGEVWVDGRQLIGGGQIVAEPDDWYEDHRELTVPAEWTDNTMIARTSLEGPVDEKGQLRRAWDTSSGKLCSVSVGRPESARRAARLYETLRHNHHTVSIATLVSLQENFALQEVLQLTCLLEKYGLVRSVLQP